MSFVSDTWNFAATHLTMKLGDDTLSMGSGFFWGKRDSTFLVTNWHNLSGRNPHTGQPMSKSGALPDRVELQLAYRTREANAEGFSHFCFGSLTVLLFEQDALTPRWLEHPVFGRKVDVAALDVTMQVRNTMAKTANETETDAIVTLSSSDDVFILGFPFGIIPGAPVPLWKRGTIALDPNYDPEGLPKLFVDTASRDGMSGSLVLAQHVVVNASYKKRDGSKAGPFIHQVVRTVAGVYSGRHYPDYEKAQLGIVWKRPTIEEVVGSGRRANVALTV
jgi:hypothetical protein